MNKYLTIALEVAEKSKCRYKHGCVVVSDGKVIAHATNKKIGDPKLEWRRSHVHAEAAAAIAAGSRISGSHVYVARIGNDGSPLGSRPCRRCQSYLQRMGVSKIVWT
jgi:pyrimidine deaminase RibD-like protein